MATTKTLRGAALWQKLVAEQCDWIQQCGGDLSGYIANYSTKHGRTVANATAIYEADVAELRRREEHLAAFNKDNRAKQHAERRAYCLSCTTAQLRNIITLERQRAKDHGKDSPVGLTASIFADAAEDVLNERSDRSSNGGVSLS